MKTEHINAIKKASKLLSLHADDDFVSRANARESCIELNHILNDHFPESEDQNRFIVHDILTEVNRAEGKHPNWPKDHIYAIAIVGEEYGEAMREAVKLQMNEEDKDISNFRKELIHTAATCIRTLKNLHI